MAAADPHQISDLLVRWSEGDEEALNHLLPRVYDELRRMARAQLRRSPTATLQTTELIHEAYLKLAKNLDRDFSNREHFFGVAATAMRHILVDYARSKNAQKRGRSPEKVSLSPDFADTSTLSLQVVELDDALQTLAKLDTRKSRVVELKYFGGLTNEETAGVLGISLETVKNDWRFARSWLLRELDRTAK